MIKKKKIKDKKKNNGEKNIDVLGVLTSGGDAPGMNAAIRAIVKRASKSSIQVLGCKDGYKGLIEKDEPFDEELNNKIVEMILKNGGSTLRSGRCEEIIPGNTGRDRRLGKAVKKINDKVDGFLIVIGGDGTMQGARALYEKSNETIRIVGIPASIDNDIPDSEYCIGYDTALNTIIDSIDKLRDTATSHKRIMVVEVMGNKSGWLAFQGGVSGGADCLIIHDDEDPDRLICIDWRRPTKKDFDFKKLCLALKRRLSRKVVQKSAIIVVAEGIFDTTVYPKGIRTNFDGRNVLIESVEMFRLVMEKISETETRHVKLGYLQRGGNPSPQDRFIASAFGVAAVEALMKGYTGCMLKYPRANKQSLLYFSDISEGPKKIEKQLIAATRSLFS